MCYASNEYQFLFFWKAIATENSIESPFRREREELKDTFNSSRNKQASNRWYPFSSLLQIFEPIKKKAENPSRFKYVQLNVLTAPEVKPRAGKTKNPKN